MKDSIYEILVQHGHQILHDYLERDEQSQKADSGVAPTKGKIALDGKGNVTMSDATLEQLVQEFIAAARSTKKYTDADIKAILLKYLNSSTVSAEINKSK